MLSDELEKINGCCVPTVEILSCKDVLRAHFILADYFHDLGEDLHLFGVKNRDAFVSAINRQVVGFENQLKWSNVYEYSATVFFGLIKNHPFQDGNKRTALLSLIYHLFNNDLLFTVSEKELDKLAVSVAEIGGERGDREDGQKILALGRYKDFEKFHGLEDGEVKFLAKFLRKNTRRIEKHSVSPTFQELKTALKKHGFEMENAGGNYINVVREEPKYFGLSKKRVSVCQVGFPGWKKQVSQNALKTIRKSTGLTQENGYDWRAIVGKVEPLNALISQYEGPLKRLRNK